MKAVKEALNAPGYRKKFAYVFLAVLVAAAFLMNFVSLSGFLQGELLFTETVEVAGLAFLFTFALLASISIILHVYKAEKLSMKSGKRLGFAGVFLGMFTSGCSVCYPLILSLLGIPAALAALPFRGAEIQALSIFILLMSVFLASRSIEKNRCDVK